MSEYFSSQRLASGGKPPLWEKTHSQWHIWRIGWAWVNDMSEPWRRKQFFWLLFLPCQRNIHSFRVASVLAVGWAKVAFLCVREESRKEYLEVPTVGHTFLILPPMFLWENNQKGGEQKFQWNLDVAYMKPIRCYLKQFLLLVFYVLFFPKHTHTPFSSYKCQKAFLCDWQVQQKNLWTTGDAKTEVKNYVLNFWQ